MKLMCGDKIFIQRSDIRFIIEDANGLELPLVVENELRDKYAKFHSESSKKDTEFVELSTEEAQKFARDALWLVDLDILIDWRKQEVINLRAMARRILAVLMNEDGEEDDKTLRDEEVEERKRRNLKLHLIMYGIHQIEDFLKAHRFVLFKKWQNCLLWQLPETT